jgi:hypothetical protein
MNGPKLVTNRRPRTGEVESLSPAAAAGVQCRQGLFNGEVGTAGAG